MKEATGELSMTVIVIVGAIALVGIISLLMPNISKYISDKWTEVTGSDWQGNKEKTCIKMNAGKCVQWSE